jgi:hypothetical protein
MQNKTRLIYIITVCTAVVFLCGFIFSRAFFPKSKAIDDKIEDNQGITIPTDPATGKTGTVKTPRQSPSAEDSKLNISNTLDGVWDKVISEEFNTYEFSNYAQDASRLFLAGCQKDDKATGIIYSIKNVSDNSSKDPKVYKLPGKGSVTLTAWEEGGNILTFSCSNGEKAYIEMKSSTVIYQNYYLKALLENPFLSPDTYEFKDLNENTVKLGKEEAIIRAASKASSEDILKEAKKISAVLVEYTNKKTPEMPHTGIILENRPTWIVTFSGIDKGQAPYDIHIFIEANIGTWLGSVSHPSLSE